MDSAHAYREAHENATLLHQGNKYIVKDLDLEQGVAEVRWKEVDYFTQAISESNLDINTEQKKKVIDDVSVRFGTVSVTEQYSHYKEKKYDRVLDVHPLQLPPLEFDTECVWLQIPETILTDLEGMGVGSRGGLHAIEHAIISLTPFYAMCDRWDIGGFSSRDPLDKGGTIFIYDAYEGGIGIAEEVYALMNELLESTYELVADCGCDEGCPSCIYSPKCGNDNDPLDKNGAIYILKELGKRFGY